MKNKPLNEDNENIEYVGRNKNHKAKTMKSCWYCGQKHNFFDRTKCPAFGKICSKCKMRNHFAKMCKKTAPTNEIDNYSEQSTTENESTTVEELYIE